MLSGPQKRRLRELHDATAEQLTARDEALARYVRREAIHAAARAGHNFAAPTWEWEATRAWNDYGRALWRIASLREQADRLGSEIMGGD